MSKTGLGKGLSALIPMSDDILGKDEPVAEISVSQIKANSFQPRRVFDEEKLEELANSINEHGVIQPVVIRRLKSGKYELVVGERRLRACQKLGLEKIPAVVKEFTDRQMMEIALVENIQRQDLNPIEEAYAYKRLLDEFRLTQEQLAVRVAKSRSFIANMVRLLNLPPMIIDSLTNNKLTVGHARPILAINNEETQLRVAAEIINRNLSVRETENIIKKIVEEEKRKEEESKAKQAVRRGDKMPPTLHDLETKLRGLCGTKVRIKDLGGQGKIEIEYYSEDDLERISSLFLQGESI